MLDKLKTKKGIVIAVIAIVIVGVIIYSSMG